MIISADTLTLCETKFGKGRFCGFSEEAVMILNEQARARIFADLEVLYQEKIIFQQEDTFHFTALGQFIFNTMLAPEQLVCIKNTVEKTCTRIYCRNTYYLWVMEEELATEAGPVRQYWIELLPTIDLIVGAFAFALKPEREPAVASGNDGAISVTCNAWKGERELWSTMTLEGERSGDKFSGEKNEQAGSEPEERTAVSFTESDLVNTMTEWLLEKLADSNEGGAEETWQQ